MSHNALTGPLPASLAAAPLLTTLDASHNGMGGTLGQYAAALPSSGGAATTLLLDHNDLSGELRASHLSCLEMPAAGHCRQLRMHGQCAARTMARVW